MNNNINKILRTGVVIFLGIAVLASCTDNWDEHYDSASIAPNAYDGTTMQALEQNASDFAEVVKATGFDVELNSSNIYTVWAPANGTFDKESLLAAAKNDTNSMVVTQFVKNHVARYSIPLDLKSKRILLLNNKKFTMSTNEEHQIGDVNITESNNIKCDNGILHIIDGELPYRRNILEVIAEEYNKSSNVSKADSSLYAYLSTVPSDTLIENQSVSNGYDENGNKLWVYKSTRPNNTILRDFNAMVYEEDSNYIALIPSVEAYQERYSKAKELLNYHPKITDADSIREANANRFAMNDLFYARSQNEHWEDSLKSTQYRVGSWPEHVYYRTTPRLLPRYKEVNDILAKVGIADSIECSNGIAYTFDEYPFSIYEQFYNVLDNGTTSLLQNYVDPSKEGEIDGLKDPKKVTSNTVKPDRVVSGTWTVLTYNVIYDIDENGDTIGFHVDDSDVINTVTQSYSYLRVRQSGSSTANPSVGFEIGNNLSGEYDIYIVTMPMWFLYEDINYIDTLKNGNTQIIRDHSSMTYNFNVSYLEKNAEGNYPNDVVRLSTRIEVSPPTNIFNITDTTFVGTHKFEHAFYGQKTNGFILQITTNVTSAQRNKYFYDFLLSGIILKPHNDDAAPVEEINATQLKALPVDARKLNSGYKTVYKNIKK